MRFKTKFIFIFLICAYQVKAQRYIWSPDSISLEDPNYSMYRYQDILRYNDPIMYLAYPVIKPIVDRKIPLKDGEGKDGYWAEGQFGYRFVIYKGKYYSYPFFQRMRFTFDVGLITRLTKDDSNPLLPLNNKFGFGLDYLITGLNQLKKEKAVLTWTTFQLHHFSNGQAGSFFSDSSETRNNYLSGDFSTNYFKGLLNIAVSSQQKNIVITSVGYQRDLDLGGPLSRSKELYNYYGDKRLLFQFQWVKKPKLVSTNVFNKSTAEPDTIKVQQRRQVGFRTEFEYIIGDLSKFSGNNKYRLGWHSYITYMPAVTNEVGFMIHTYVGRDYMNIRFDDIVFIGAAGLYVKFETR